MTIQKCSVCGMGDGKWKERTGQKMDDSLPVCDKCKLDGWTNDPKEIMEAFNNDPNFQLGVEDPYKNI